MGRFPCLVELFFGLTNVNVIVKSEFTSNGMMLYNNPIPISNVEYIIRTDNVCFHLEITK